MAKLVIFFNPVKDIVFGNLKVKVDEDKIIEVKKEKSNSLELDKGEHSITMYVPGLTEDDIWGYVNTNIIIDDDNSYYIYKLPFNRRKPGKFQKVNGEKEFKKAKRKDWLFIISLIVLYIIISLLQKLI